MPGPDYSLPEQPYVATVSGWMTDREVLLEREEDRERWEELLLRHGPARWNQ